MGFDAWVVEMVRRWWAEVCAQTMRGLQLRKGEGLMKGDGKVCNGDGVGTVSFNTVAVDAETLKKETDAWRAAWMRAAGQEISKG